MLTRRFEIFLLGVAIATVLAGCSAPETKPTAASGSSGSPAEQQPVAKKRVVAAMVAEPTSLVSRMNPGQVSLPGGNELEELVNGALSEVNTAGDLQPTLAERVPTLENGLWKVYPDGRMETTWKIRANATWQDGTPLTSADLVFTTTVDQDKSVPIPTHALPYQSVDHVEAPDPHTIVVYWSEPQIFADTMFTQAFASPLPKHLLQDAYLADPQSFVSLPFWTQGFVGCGPFQLVKFTPGSSVLLKAYDNYALGRPKLDEIEVRFIPDANTLTTNILSGTVEMTIGRGLGAQQAMQLKDSPGVRHVQSSAIVLYPQFINPSPAAVDDVRFRKALMYGTDRQQLADAIGGGLSGVADMFYGPSEPGYKEILPKVLHYEYDPQKAVQMLQSMGLVRGPGGQFRSADQPLNLEIRSSQEKVIQDAVVPISNMWSQLGVPTDPLIVPVQRIGDREFIATFPAFQARRQPANASWLQRLHSSNTALPENGFVGNNYSRFRSATFDGLLERFFTTIPQAERQQALGDVLQYLTDNLNVMTLFYDLAVNYVSPRITNVPDMPTDVSNVHEWAIGS